MRMAYAYCLLKKYSSLSSRKSAFEYFLKVARTNVPSQTDAGPRDRFYPCLGEALSAGILILQLYCRPLCYNGLGLIVLK